jgi:hypothetical protein
LIDFLEILVAVYVIVIALIVVLTQLESTLDNRSSRPRPVVRRSKLASVDARAADLRYRSRLHVDR